MLQHCKKCCNVVNIVRNVVNVANNVVSVVSNVVNIDCELLCAFLLPKHSLCNVLCKNCCQMLQKCCECCNVVKNAVKLSVPDKWMMSERSLRTRLVTGNPLE